MPSCRRPGLWWIAVCGLLAGVAPLVGCDATLEPKTAAVEAAEPAAGGAAEPSSGAVERLGVRVLGSHPHDPAAYTQGLLWDGDELVESTGLYGASSLRRWSLSSPTPRLEVPLEPQFFGEGLARVGDRLIQLTWREGVALVWDRLTLSPLDRISYRGQGWGLCHDGSRLFMSDGSDRLTVRDPTSFEAVDRLRVVSPEGGSVANLNELECAEGWVFANVFGSERIARIDPRDGRLTAWIDASGLLSAGERGRAEVLNGIAYRPDREAFYLTGKYWPRVFEVVFEARGGR